MSRESKLARRTGETETPLAQDTFDLTAMKSMAEKIKDLQVFMNEHLEQGLNKDWEYAHIIWKRELKKGDDAKPCLLDPGVAKIMNFMTVRPRQRIIEKEIDTATMQLRYVVAVEIVPFLPIMYHNPVTNAMEPIYPVIAEGLGSATTREKRYKVRFEWMKERDLKVEGWTADELRKYAEENPDKYREKTDPKYDNLYYMPTAESLGLDNTLLKMGAKRANLDAVFQLPGVAGRYSQEIDLKEDEIPKLAVEEKKSLIPNIKDVPVMQPKQPTTSPPPTEAPKQEESKPAERPNLRDVNLDSLTESTIAFQRENKGLSRAQILARMEEEKMKAGGNITDEDAVLRVAQSLVKQPEPVGFTSASELPKVPDDFRPGEEASHIVDYIVENYNQPPETVRALVYREMNQAEPHLTDVEAAKAVQASYEERSQPAAPEDNLAAQMNEAGLDAEKVNISKEEDEVQPRKFLGDIWGGYNDFLRSKGFTWIRDDKNSRWSRL